MCKDIRPDKVGSDVRYGAFATGFKILLEKYENNLNKNNSEGFGTRKMAEYFNVRMGTIRADGHSNCIYPARYLAEKTIELYKEKVGY